jgi:Cytochrome P450
MIEATGKFPADGHPALSFTYLLNKYNLWSKGLVYIDTYPLVNDNLLIATTPEAAAEITERNFVRHPFMTNFYGRVVGIKSMTLAEGQQWKDLRKTFNPGFSLTNVMTLMPEIVKQGEIFTTILSNIAKNGGFAESLDELARGVTLDIIFRVVLGLETNTQRDPTSNEVGNLLEKMSQWSGNPQSMNPLRKLNVPKWIMLRYTEWRIKKILTAAILKRWEVVKENQAVMKTGEKGSKELKLVIDLALKHYCDENVGNDEKLRNLSDDYLDTLSDK